jgi:hypothetical protein
MAVLGATVLASFGVAAIVGAMVPSVGYAQRTPAANGPTGGLIALATDAGGQRQQVTVIDPQTRVLSVYHIDLATGNAKLTCVRNINWDLQMMEFNGESPTPREVRSIVEQR